MEKEINFGWECGNSFHSANGHTFISAKLTEMRKIDAFAPSRHAHTRTRRFGPFAITFNCDFRDIQSTLLRAPFLDCASTSSAVDCMCSKIEAECAVR